MKEQLAVIKSVGYGNRDVGRPCLWFDVTFLNGGALLVFIGHDAEALIQTSGVYDIKALEGKPCIITEEHNIIKFVRFHS